VAFLIRYFEVIMMDVFLAGFVWGCH